MKNKFFIIIISLLLLTSCAEVPEGVKTANSEGNAEHTEPSIETYDTITDVVAESYDIYENNYGQIKINAKIDPAISDATKVMNYSLSFVSWDDTDHEKVLEFFHEEGLCDETKLADSGTAFDGDWVEYSDGKRDIVMDYQGYIAYSDNELTSGGVISDSFKYGDEKCDKKYTLKNGEYSFNEINEYLSEFVNNWKRIDKSFDLIPAEIYIWEDENGNNMFDIYYAKQANGIRFDYELFSTISEYCDYMYLNICVNSYGNISFISNNNGIFEIEKSEEITGSFVSLDSALKILQEKFTPHTDFTITEIMLFYEMIYDKDGNCSTVPCWRFNLDDNSTKDEYTHKMVRNVYVDITTGEFYDSYDEQACW